MLVASDARPSSPSLWDAFTPCGFVTRGPGPAVSLWRGGSSWSCHQWLLVAIGKGCYPEQCPAAQCWGAHPQGASGQCHRL